MTIRHPSRILLGTALCLLAIAPGAARAGGQRAWYPPLAWHRPVATASPHPAATASAPTAVVYSGLVIDATGLGFLPCMSPGLVDADDRNLLAGLTFDPDQVADQGLASWVHSNPGPDWPRTGPHPLEVKALRADGDRLVFSDADGQKIREADAHDRFLENLKVTVVY